MPYLYIEAFEKLLVTMTGRKASILLLLTPRTKSLSGTWINVESLRRTAVIRDRIHLGTAVVDHIIRLKLTNQVE